jgi:hypothetical protein
MSRVVRLQFLEVGPSCPIQEVLDELRVVVADLTISSQSGLEKTKTCLEPLPECLQTCPGESALFLANFHATHLIISMSILCDSAVA